MSKKNKPDSSVHIPQRDKVAKDFEIKEFNWTKRQIEIIKQLEDKNNKIIFLNGPSGSSKTLLSIYVALKYLKEKKVGEIYYVRSIIESATKSIGALPGSEFDKFRPFAMPLEDKLQELLNKITVDQLFKEERIKCLPINFMRGLSVNVGFLVCDEFQNFQKSEAITLLTRLGKFSKLILCGDSRQSDINGKSCLKEMVETFSDEESRQNGVISIQLTEEDIMRSEIVKFIVKKLKLT